MIGCLRLARRRCGAGIVLLAALGVWPTGEARATDPPAVIHRRAFMNLNAGAFEEALADFEMLVAIMGESTTPSVVASLEPVYFNVGVCRFFLGRFEAAEEAFDRYIRQYPRRGRAHRAAHFIADSKRFREQFGPAIRAYEDLLRRYMYSPGERADIFGAIARCYLAEQKWDEAVAPLEEVYRHAVDALHRNWAATVLATAYLKTMDLEKVYRLTPVVLRPDGFAARSVAFNLAALEAGDFLFGEERYREALWLFRMVYRYRHVEARAGAYLETLRYRADAVRRRGGDPRDLMRIQESIGELEAERAALTEIAPYDTDLTYRIARGYMEFQRFREARELFLHLHETADRELAEECLYLAYLCASQVPPPEGAHAIGARYMARYPGGRYYDDLTLSMGQRLAAAGQWPEVIAHFTTVLEVSPDHQAGAECMFLLGYALFMEEQFVQAQSWLRRLRERYPGSEWVTDATYWIGMALLFDLDYAEAQREFGRVARELPPNRYVEDAVFRIAVCEYGLERMASAETLLAAFVRTRPDSPLVGEATMMRGDVAGALGRPAAAVAFYREAMTSPHLNAELYNHCAFQAGRILNDDGDMDAMQRHFEAYLAEAREGANLPQAMYWIGVALWNRGEPEGAMQFYLDAIARYGRERDAMGIDLIVDEWIARTRRMPAADAAQAWRRLREAIAEAVRERQPVLAMRLQRALFYDAQILSSVRARLASQFLNPQAWPHQSAAVLRQSLQLALDQGAPDTATALAETIVATFPETDTALEARMILARDRVARAAEQADASVARLLHVQAIEHLETVRRTHAESAEAAEAMLLLGDIYRRQRRFEEADAALAAVLGVRAWRPHWPEALYGRGECAFEQRRFDVAAAYYERIYLLYAHYTDWTARAYLRRADALRRAFRPEQAREVLREMLATAALQDRPEIEAARNLLRQLEGGAS